MKYCPDCGCENIDEAQFCRNCGFKFNAEVAQNVSEVKKASPNAVDDDINPIVEKLFYKTDRLTGELRFAKAKTIGIVIFILMFLFGLISGSEGSSFAVVFIVAIIFGLIFAIPLYVLGFIVSIIIDKLSQ